MLFTCALTAHPRETYGNVTPQQWRDGLRYADILSQKFCQGKPLWMDREAIRCAALDGLMAAARNYNPSRGRWSTVMHPSITRYMDRAWIAEQNHQLRRPPTSRFWETKDHDPEQPMGMISLDSLPLVDGDRLEELLSSDDDPAVEVLERLDGAEWAAKTLRVLAELRPVDREILLARAAGRSLRELAQGITHESVRQREKHAIRRARAVARQMGLAG